MAPVTIAAAKTGPAQDSSSKAWAIVGGALKMTLSGAVSFIPEPFKGPAEVLVKVIDAFEVSGPACQLVLLAKNA
jgi:hypothetical protein